MKTYRYEFPKDIEMAEVDASLLLAVLATEDLHGSAQARLEVSYYLDDEQRSCVINADTEAAKTLNRIFVGFLQREFGADAFSVRRVDVMPNRPIDPNKRHTNGSKR